MPNPRIVFLALGLLPWWHLVGEELPEPLERYLGPTELIDSTHSSIRATASRLISGNPTAREQAVAIHDFVRDEITYEFGPKFYDHRASEVLRARRGFCNTKTTLFIALLRASDIPSRPRFVEISSQILDGIVDPGTPWLDHSFTEVWLEGRWIPVDSYIVDPGLFRAAQQRLEREGRDFGYGVHRSGSLSWDGLNPNFSQYVTQSGSSPVGNRDFGVHADVLDFYENTPDAWNRMDPGTRAFFRFATVTFNARIKDVRDTGRRVESRWKPGIRTSLRGPTQ